MFGKVGCWFNYEVSKNSGNHRGFLLVYLMKEIVFASTFNHLYFILYLVNHRPTQIKKMHKYKKCVIFEDLSSISKNLLK